MLHILEFCKTNRTDNSLFNCNFINLCVIDIKLSKKRFVLL